MTQANDANDSDVVRAVREFMAHEFPKRAEAIKRLPAEAPLAELGVLDSLAVLTLAAFLEAKWSVKVPPKTYKASFHSLRQIEETVDRLRRASRGA